MKPWEQDYQSSDEAKPWEMFGEESDDAAKRALLESQFKTDKQIRQEVRAEHKAKLADRERSGPGILGYIPAVAVLDAQLKFLESFDEKEGAEATFTENMGRGMMDVYQGAMQLGNHLGDALKENPVMGQALQSNPFTAPLSVSLQEASEKGETENYDEKIANEMAIYNENNDGFTWGRLAGGIATPISLIPGGAATMTGRMALGAAAGALGSGLQVTSDPEDYWEQKAITTGFGAALGGVIPAGATAAKHIYNGTFGPNGFFRQIVRPFSHKGIYKDIHEFLVKEIPENREKIVAAIEGSIARGEKRTVAQILAEATQGSGEDFGGIIARLEDDLRRNSDVIKTIYASQRKGMTNVVDRLAGTEEAYESLLTSRANTANKMYGDVSDDLIDPRSSMEMITDSIKKTTEKIGKKFQSKASALQDEGRFKTLGAHQAARAHTPIAREAGEAATETAGISAARQAEMEALDAANQVLLKNTIGADNVGLSKFLSRPSVLKAIREARKAAQETGEYWPENTGDKFSVGNLQRIKRAVADNLKINKEQGTLGATQQKEIAKTLDSFTGWLRKKSPGFAKAEDQFRKDSIPINKMAVGKQLKDALSDSLGKQTPAAFAKAMKDSAKTLKRATGFSRFKKLTDVLDEEDVKELAKIKHELSVNAKKSRMAKESMSVVNTIDGSVELQLPHILSRPVVIANHILKIIGQDKTPQYKRLLVDLIEHPDRFLEAYRLPIKNPRAQMAVDIIDQVRQAGGIAATQQIGQE